MEDRQLAMQIAQELGGLPLALDQAGAYLEETGRVSRNIDKSTSDIGTTLLQERRGTGL